MFFFRKKEKKEAREYSNIQVIPEEFYGAKDPVIHYEKMEAEGVQKKQVTVEKKKLKMPAISLRPIVSRLWENKKIRYAAIGILFLMIVAGISWYYLSPSITPKQQQLAKTETNESAKIEQKEEPVVEKEQPTATSTEPEVLEEEMATSTPSLEKEMVLEFPLIQMTNSEDIDSDSLTDMEEQVFSTDSGTWDTEGDGYYDGQEVFNLYSPKGAAPTKLIDSGLIKEYVNTKWQYRLYYPLEWEVGEVDKEKRQVLFSSITGDYIEVQVWDKESSQDFSTWFGEKASGQKFSDLLAVTNRFKQDGWRRKDDLVAYFTEDDLVFVLIYYSSDSSAIQFRHIMQMIIQSFRPSKVLIDIPPQVVLPIEPGDIIGPVEQEGQDEENITPTSTEEI